ncbi:UNKNOWN [Stylonychia lemnae]|uniref:Uncharacterized protein n=1 Tax=Stylonychia lemnae TaxID=5949 RepID=A0A078AM13_STYLE|nr:UNKNOWN [Stylonychia lemnae]|eukprot:CDW83269.1 UNKNOWN [Stylonychia lemnae]
MLKPQTASHQTLITPVQNYHPKHHLVQNQKYSNSQNQIKYLQHGYENITNEAENYDQPAAEKKIKKKVQVINILKKITGKPRDQQLNLDNISDNQSIYNTVDRQGSFHEGFATVSHKKYNSNIASEISHNYNSNNQYQLQYSATGVSNQGKNFSQINNKPNKPPIQHTEQKQKQNFIPSNNRSNFEHQQPVFNNTIIIPEKGNDSPNMQMKKFGQHKRSETAIELHMNPQQQLFYKKQGFIGGQQQEENQSIKSILKKIAHQNQNNQISQLQPRSMSNDRSQPQQFRNINFNAGYTYTQTDHQNLSNGQSPTNFMISKSRIQSEIQSQNNDQVPYMTLKVKAKPSIITTNNGGSLRQSMTHQVSKERIITQKTFDKNINMPRIETSATPIIINTKIIANMPSLNRQSTVASALKRNDSYQKNLQNNAYFQEGASQTPVSGGSSFIKGSKNQTYNVNTSGFQNALTLKKEHSDQFFPSIKQQKTQLTDQSSQIPKIKYPNSSQYTNQMSQDFGNDQDTANEMIDNYFNGNQSQGVNKNNYHKMITKLVQKQPTHHQRNYSHQIEQSSSAGPNGGSLKEKLNLENQIKLNVNLQNKVLNTRNEDIQGKIQNIIQTIQAKQSQQDQKNQLEIAPIFKLPASTNQSQNIDREDESPYNNQMNQPRKVQSSETVEENYSPTTQETAMFKNNVIKSYQTELMTELTPQYQMKVGGNQLNSVLQIAQFKESLEKQSTQMSSNHQNFSRHNSGQMLPFIASVGSSQIKLAQNMLPQNSGISNSGYQQILQKMIGMRDSSGNKNPLENSLKSSHPNVNSNKQNSKLGNGEKKTTSLIKEDSNEEKSSSNSNSNQEIIIDPKVKPIQKQDLFTKQLKQFLKTKHARQKTAQLLPIFGRIQNNLIEKRYNEDLDLKTTRDQQTQRENAEKSESNQVNQSQSQLQSFRVLTNLESDRMRDSLYELLASDNTTARVEKKKSTRQADKNKFWLLDSSRFDQAIEQQKLQKLKEDQLSDEQDLNMSDTVVFDKDSSSNDTPPNKGAKGKVQKFKEKEVKKSEEKVLVVKQETVEPVLKSQNTVVNQSNKSFAKSIIEPPSSRQAQVRSSINERENESNFITIEAQDDLDETNTQSENQQSMIVNQLLTHTKNSIDSHNFQIRIEETINEIYKRLNVDVSEKILLYPKFKLPALDNFFQPSYYDIIYVQSSQYTKDYPSLEGHFNFDE